MPVTNLATDDGAASACGGLFYEMRGLIDEIVGKGSAIADYDEIVREIAPHHGVLTVVCLACDTGTDMAEELAGCDAAVAVGIGASAESSEQMAGEIAIGHVGRLDGRFIATRRKEHEDVPRLRGRRRGVGADGAAVACVGEYDFIGRGRAAHDAEDLGVRQAVGNRRDVVGAESAGITVAAEVEYDTVALLCAGKLAGEAVDDALACGVPAGDDDDVVGGTSEECGHGFGVVLGLCEVIDTGVRVVPHADAHDVCLGQGAHGADGGKEQ